MQGQREKRVINTTYLASPRGKWCRMFAQLHFGALHSGNSPEMISARVWWWCLSEDQELTPCSQAAVWHYSVSKWSLKYLDRSPDTEWEHRCLPLHIWGIHEKTGPLDLYEKKTQKLIFSWRFYIKHYCSQWSLMRDSWTQQGLGIAKIIFGLPCWTDWRNELYPSCLLLQFLHVHVKKSKWY